MRTLIRIGTVWINPDYIVGLRAVSVGCEVHLSSGLITTVEQTPAEVIAILRPLYDPDRR